MANNIYSRLREQLDQYGLGFATTESGVEIKILKKLFSEEEAEMYLNLSENLQSAEQIAKKANQDPKKVEELLQRMTKKGHTFPRFPKKVGEPFYYAAAPFVHGILEHQLNIIDKEMAELLEEFFKAGPITKPVPGLRTIPVNSAIDENLKVAPYDDAKNVIMKKERIAIAECVCNNWQTTRGGTCKQPKEVCFLFDFYAQYYVDRGLGRWVSKEEALEKLKIAENAGLIPQFSNSENPEALCNCCPDCCGSLRGLKQLPQPALVVPTNYFAAVNAEMCSACETCIDRCPMDAIVLNK
jgi:NAD-dependent dihydropyrimidine dehydrogenase PreA subunit/predicted transcriptional regulator